MLAAAILPLVGLTGLLASLLPAFGWSPVADQSPLPAWSTLTSLSGLTQMLTVTLITGLASTALSLLFVLIFACCCWKTRLWTLAEFTLPPLLCIPHTALAAGVSFLLAPTGVLGRLLAAINGWEIPPDLTTINDAWGLSLIFTLVLKEAPFLALMAISACRQIPVEKLLVTGQSLGYSPSLCWVKIVWTPLYRALRLPVLTVLIYSISVVDISMMTGPSLPPTLPVQILLWYQDPDLLYQAPAAAAVALLLVLSAIAVLCYLAAEKGVSYCLQPWITGGLRHLPHWIFMIGRGLWSGLSATSLGCLLLVALWSFITRWPFPDMLPCDWSLQLWSRHVHRLQTPLSTTLTLALLSTLAALVLAVTLLELGKYQTDRLRKATTITVYIPLLIPQIALMPGIQTLLISLNIDGLWATVIGCHLLFVFPYCYLSLAQSWRSYDARYSQTGHLLSGSRLRTFLYIKLPMLLPCLLTSSLLGASISSALYLPTLMPGAGRFETLTTEAVALSSGGSRSLLALYALVQVMPPLAIMAMAKLLPAALKRRTGRPLETRPAHKENAA